MDISVIIPVYNEENTISDTMEMLRPLTDRCEILFVDGGSTDRTVSMISDEFRVINSLKGRANQMNQGAMRSSGKVLFFLHCDSVLPDSALEQIEEVMEKCRAGYFGIRFDSGSLIMKTCAFMSNLRSVTRGIVFGDQGIFIDRELFFEAGMFPAIAIMEDYQFSLNLRKMKIRPVRTRDRISTSDRRFGRGNVRRLRVMWNMHRLRFLYRKGLSADEIARMYRDIR